MTGDSAEYPEGDISAFSLHFRAQPTLDELLDEMQEYGKFSKLTFSWGYGRWSFSYRLSKTAEEVDADLDCSSLEEVIDAAYNLWSGGKLM